MLPKPITRKNPVASHRPFYMDKVQCSEHCHQQSRSWESIFLKSQIYYVSYTHKSMCWHPGEKMLINAGSTYIKSNSDLTTKLSARMLWPWGTQQTCPVAMNHHISEYNLQRHWYFRGQIETRGEFLRHHLLQPCYVIDKKNQGKCLVSCPRSHKPTNYYTVRIGHI